MLTFIFFFFYSKTIRCTPCTVHVTARTDLHADVTDKGFIPSLIYLDQGHTVCWSWESSGIPHTVTEVSYAVDKGCFRKHRGKSSHMVATVTGKHRQQFKWGLWSFYTLFSALFSALFSDLLYINEILLPYSCSR